MGALVSYVSLGFFLERPYHWTKSLRLYTKQVLQFFFQLFRLFLGYIFRKVGVDYTAYYSSDYKTIWGKMKLQRNKH